MTHDIQPSPSVSLPLPSLPIAVRPATRADVPFIDALQKRHGKALGFFPRAQLEGYIDNGWALVAEGVGSQESGVRREDGLQLLTPDSRLATPLGYVLSRDRYLKRDELGVIYQLCVSPSAQRGLVGATLIKEVFARSAYGCKLFCCWCAQDLAANKFWEAMGFQAIAFRGGSAKKSRVHIYWQRRVRADATPWWFPAKTDGGAIREDRIVLPIPPSLHWRDAMPVMVAEPVEKAPKVKRAKMVVAAEPIKARKPALRFGPPGFDEQERETTPAATAIVPVLEATSLPAPARAKVKADPKLIAAARELRDRYLEQVNDPVHAVPTLVGQYDVGKAIEAKTQVKLLAA